MLVESNLFISISLENLEVRSVVTEGQLYSLSCSWKTSRTSKKFWKLKAGSQYLFVYCLREWLVLPLIVFALYTNITFNPHCLFSTPLFWLESVNSVFFSLFPPVELGWWNSVRWGFGLLLLHLIFKPSSDINLFSFSPYHCLEARN